MSKKMNAYEDTRMFYTLNVVNLLHFSVTFLDHLQGGVLRRLYYKGLQTEYYHPTWMVIRHTHTHTAHEHSITRVNLAQITYLYFIF